MSNAIATLTEDIYAQREAFAAVLSEPTLNFDREAGFAVQAMQSNDFLAKIAMSNRQSLVNAVNNTASIGISLNPAKKQAYLVPRDGRVCLDISYMGLVDLATSTGSIRWAQAELVHASDHFELSGIDRAPLHKFNPFHPERGDIVGAYVVVKTADGDYLTTTMSRADIDSIMQRSQSFRSGKSSPWKTDYGEMAKKGLALDTPIPTPSGWIDMGSIDVGDSVFDKDGVVVRVKAVSEIKHLTCFRVKFSNGDEIVCDNEHRWLARFGGSHAHRKDYSVMTVNTMYEAKLRGDAVTVPVQGPLDLPESDLPIDPYLLGYWLGDGTHDRANITCGTIDIDHVKTAIDRAGYKVGAVTKDKRSESVCVGIIDGFRVALAEAGLLGNKHIPAAYLRGSIQQRKALLAGLLDSDGHLDKARGRVHFYSKTEALSRGVYELAASLGEVPVIDQKSMRGYGVTSISFFVQWQPSFCPCELERKAANYRERKIGRSRVISSIEVIPTVPTRCIAVTGDSETFLAGRSMAPTHNTVVKRAYKYWPKTDRLDQAIHYLNTDSGEGLAQEQCQQEPQGDPELIKELLANVENAGSAEALAEVWKEGIKRINAAKDKAAHPIFKDAVQARGDAIKSSQANVYEGEVQ